MHKWKKIFEGEIGVRRVRVEQSTDSTLRVSTLVTGTALEVEIVAETPGQLKQRLIEDGEFTEHEAVEIINKIILP